MPKGMLGIFSVVKKEPLLSLDATPTFFFPRTPKSKVKLTVSFAANPLPLTCAREPKVGFGPYSPDIEMLGLVKVNKTFTLSVLEFTCTKYLVPGTGAEDGIVSGVKKKPP